MPAHWKQNRPLQRVDTTFVNWDCSTHGFEGVRAQDILPMLVSRFHFHKLAAWGGILDPFIDRAYGHNFDITKDFDRLFVDELWRANRNLIKLGVVKPTQMIAVMKNEPGELRSADDLDPSYCIREPGAESLPGVDIDAVEPAGAADDGALRKANSGSRDTLGAIPRRLEGVFTKALVESPKQDASISESHSGTWFDSSRQGEGLQIEIGYANGARTLLATWNTYQNGQQLWLTGATELPAGSAEINLSLVRTHGAQFGGDFRPKDVVVEPWGTLRLSVAGPGRLHMHYQSLDGYVFTGYG